MFATAGRLAILRAAAGLVETRVKSSVTLVIIYHVVVTLRSSVRDDREHGLEVGIAFQIDYAVIMVEILRAIFSAQYCIW